MIHQRACRHSIYFLVLSLLSFASGCATPVGVESIDSRAVHQTLTRNVLSTGEPSPFSVQFLRRLGLYEKFENYPERTLAELHGGVKPQGDEERIFALAELAFHHAQESGERKYFLMAAVYAYAFLFPGAQGTSPHAIDPRLRWAVDLYNRALTAGFKDDASGTIVFNQDSHKLPFAELSVAFDRSGLSWAGYQLSQFVPAAELEVRGLRNRYRRPGIGASLAATLEPLESAAVRREHARIPSSLKVPVTAFLEIDDVRQALLTGKLNGRLKLFNPDSASTLTIGDAQIPIEYETTSALAYSLEGAPVWDFEIAGLRRGDFRVFGADRSSDGLFMLHPHRPGRIPVVLVHGTASSPARWAELINELESDPVVREHYDVWYFLYNTGNPIPYSASLLRDALSRAIAELDPQGVDPGLKKLVVVGHSQGGILAKMMAIDSGDRLWNVFFNVPLEEAEISPANKELLQRALIVQPLDFVSRVIFIATPHRGSYLAGGVARWLAEQFISLPGNMLRLTREILTLRALGQLKAKFERFPTSIENMDPSSTFTRTLAAVPVVPGVWAHSIIAINDDGPPEKGGDGVVRYQSAHIEGAASEKIVRSGHSAQSHPETIEEIKRILAEHLKDSRSRS